jgi:chorismate mutase
MPNYNTELKKLREQIDIVDDNICSWLAVRVNVKRRYSSV